MGYIKWPLRHYKIYSGVTVITTSRLPRVTVNPSYKIGSVGPLRKFVKAGDKMISVGGGYGVTAVVGAFQGAAVTVYEGGSDYADFVRKTALINGVADSIKVIEGIVSESREVYGTPSSAKFSPGELPTCDVLELDCEGAEYAIISEMKVRPRVIVVEVHPQYNVIEDDILHALTDAGYEIVDRYDFLKKRNFTLTAIRRTDCTKEKY